MYIREDLAYNLIRSNNLGVIKADEFLKEIWNFKQQINSKRKNHNSHNNENICERKYSKAA